MYQHRNDGRSSARIVIHKSTHFPDDEVEGAVDAFTAVPDVSLMQIQDDTPWRGINIEAPPLVRKRGQPTPFPCRRGTSVPLGGRDALPRTAGNAPDATGDHNFFTECKAIPAPLMLRCAAGTGGWGEVARPVLVLTKMNLNSDGLYDRLPTTMESANILARNLKRIDNLSSRPYPFRLFM